MKVLAIQKQRVKLGVEAPNHVRVVREEIVQVPSEGDADSPGSAAELQGFPILVVEDDRSHALLITKTLEECFLSNVRVVTTGEAALHLLEPKGLEAEFMPRLVFLDFHLPDISGLEILRKIRTSPLLKTTPVVLLSAEQREEVVVSCLEAGANAFVSKSVHFGDFRRSVARIAMFWTSECRLPPPAHAAQPA